MTPELGEGRVGAFGSEDWIFFPEKSSVLHNIYIYICHWSNVSTKTSNTRVSNPMSEWGASWLATAKFLQNQSLIFILVMYAVKGDENS